MKPLRGLPFGVRLNARLGVGWAETLDRHSRRFGLMF
jgi:hypothetical protein